MATFKMHDGRVVHTSMIRSIGPYRKRELHGDNQFQRPGYEINIADLPYPLWITDASPEQQERVIEDRDNLISLWMRTGSK